MHRDIAIKLFTPVHQTARYDTTRPKDIDQNGTIKDTRKTQPVPISDDSAERVFRSPETHPLVRLFDKSNQLSTPDSLLSTPSAPSSLNVTSPVTASLSPPQTSYSVSPVIDLDTGAITPTQKPVSPILRAMSPADALHIPQTTEPQSISSSPESKPSLTSIPANSTLDVPSFDANTNPNRLAPRTPSRAFGALTPSSIPQQPQQLSSAKLTPRNTHENGSNPMVRARSHSDQENARENGFLKADPSPPQRYQHQRATPSIADLKANNAIPLARRVRSATTLRRSDEDTVPLKALVATKQQQYQLQKRQNSAPLEKSKDSPHRRSISADNPAVVVKIIAVDEAGSNSQVNIRL